MKNKAIRRFIPVILSLVTMQQIAFADTTASAAAPAPAGDTTPALMSTPVATTPAMVAGDSACPCNFSVDDANLILAKLKQKDGMCNVMNSTEAIKGVTYGVSLMIMDMSTMGTGKSADHAALLANGIDWGAIYTVKASPVGAQTTRMCSNTIASVMTNPSAGKPIMNIKQYQACVSDLEKIANLIGLTCKSN